MPVHSAVESAFRVFAPYPLEHGQFIQVRQRPYVVIGIEQSALPPDPMRASIAAPLRLVTMNSRADSRWARSCG